MKGKCRFWPTVGIMYLSVQVAISKYHRLGGLNDRHLFSHSSESWKSIINVPANSVSVRTFFLACLWPPSYCILTVLVLCSMEREKDWEKEREMVCLPLLIKTPVLSHEGPTPATSFNINYLFKCSYTGGWGFQNMDFWGTQFCPYHATLVINVTQLQETITYMLH